MAVAFGRATPSLRQAPLMCLDNLVLGNIIFSLNGEHHLLLKVLHFRVDKRCIYQAKKIYIANSFFFKFLLCFFPLTISFQPDLFYAATSRGSFLKSLSNSSLFSSKAQATSKRRSATVRTDL